MASVIDPFGHSAITERGRISLFARSFGKGVHPDAPDPVYVDDVLLTGGGKSLPALPADGSTDGVAAAEWPPGALSASPSFTASASLFTPSDSIETWRIHYEPGRPVSFYVRDRDGFPEVALGIVTASFGYTPGFAGDAAQKISTVRIDHLSEDAVWARVGNAGNPVTVVSERDDWPRFSVGAGSFMTSEPLTKPTDDSGLPENVYLIGDTGFAVASTRKLDVLGNLASVEKDAWFMVCRAKTKDMLSASARVFSAKVYDGPYPYSARGTDIKIADPAPLPSEAEYAFYSYDETGLRGIYRERHDGVLVQKQAVVISSFEVLERAESRTGDFYYEPGSSVLTGDGTLTYRLPLHATKVRNIFWRGTEVSVRASFDGSPMSEYHTMDDYDGLATDELVLEFRVAGSLSSFRVEYESLEGWYPYGRPRVDLAVEGSNTGTKIVMSGYSGEGLVQYASLPTGDYTVSANARVKRGSAVIGVADNELVRWLRSDKTIRAGGTFTCERGVYPVVLTGVSSERDTERGVPASSGVSDTYHVEYDRMRIATGEDTSWASGDISYTFEGEGSDGEVASYVDATGGVNLPEVASAPPSGRRWRLRISAPDSLGTYLGEDGSQTERDALLSSARVEIISTGTRTYSRTLRYEIGDEGTPRTGTPRAGTPRTGTPRIHYPESLVNRPFTPFYTPTDTSGGLKWTLEDLEAPTDVKLTVEGAPLAYPVDTGSTESSGDSGFFYLPATLSGGDWRVEIASDEASVYRRDILVGRVRGVGLPFQVSRESFEDVQIECPEGTVQLRRGMGPRFEEWKLEYATVPVAERGAVVAFGVDDAEATSNLALVALRLTAG